MATETAAPPAATGAQPKAAAVETTAGTNSTAAPPPDPKANILTPTLAEIMKKGTAAMPAKEEKPAEASAEKAAKEATAKAEEGKTVEKKEGESSPKEGAETKGVKRVIKRAKGYENVPAVDKAVEAATKAAEAATKAAEVVTKAAEARQPEVKQPEIKLDPEEEKRLKVFEAMGDMDPKRFKDLAANARKYLTEYESRREKFEAKFRADWERRNPDSKFDTEEERNSAFMDAFEAAFEKSEVDVKQKLGVVYTEDDYAEGIVHLRTKEIRDENERLRKEQERLAKIEEDRLIRAEAEQFTGAAVADLASNVKAKVGEDYAAVLGEDGAIDEAALKRLPYGEEVADVVSAALKGAVNDSRAMAEAITIFGRGGDTPMRNAVLWLLDTFEQEMAKKPEEERLDETGRRFVTRAEYQKLTPEQRKERWLMTPDHLVAFANDKLLERAAATIKAERDRVAAIEKKVMERYGIKPGENKKAEEQAKQRSEKPPMATSTDARPGAAGAAVSSQDWLKSMMGKTIINGRVVTPE